MALIGNQNLLAFNLVPVTPSWELRYGPERAAWAGLALWVGGNNLCLHVYPGSTALQEYLYVPLAPIVEWLIRSFAAIQFEERAADFPTTHDLHKDAARWATVPPPEGVGQDQWVDARDEWWSRHFWRAGAEGARLPNIALVRNDENFVVTWASPTFFGEAPPRMIHETGEFSIPWVEALPVLESFAAQVAEWLRQSNADDVYTWAPHRSPLQTAQVPLSEALTLFTGRQVTALQDFFRVRGFDDLLRTLGLVESTADPASSPQCQILRDLSPYSSKEIGEVVVDIGRRSARDDRVALAKWKRARAITLDASRPAKAPVQAGYLAAEELRRSLGLDGQPVTDLDSVLNDLGLSYSHTGVPSTHDRMVVALREGGSVAAATLQTGRTAQAWGRRFEAVRALGHALLDPIRSGTIGAASGPFAQETRRRRSGSFAAEFLLPEPALAAASGERLDGAADYFTFERLLEEYGVGARTAAYQLWNRGWLSDSDVRDELIDQFAALDEDDHFSHAQQS